jgi:hypothetical protein
MAKFFKVLSTFKQMSQKEEKTSIKPQKLNSRRLQNFKQKDKNEIF